MNVALLTAAVEVRRRNLDPGSDPHTEPLRRADATARIALHLSPWLQRALAIAPDGGRRP